MFKEQPALTIDSLLSRLDEWRFFPKFQLERHFDVILSFILPDLLAQYEKEAKIFHNQNIEVTPECIAKAHLIPEFPLPLKLFNSQHKNYQAIAVDFALFIPHRELNRIEHVLFVELKTDEGSARDSQTTYMNRIQTEKKPFSEYLEAIRLMILKSKQNAKKYLFLLQKLSNLELLQGLDEMLSAFQEMNVFYKDKYLKADSISKQANEVDCYSLVMAPGAVVDKIQADPNLRQLSTLSFLQAEQLLVQLQNKNNEAEPSLLLSAYLRKWDQSPLKKIGEFLRHQKT